MGYPVFMASASARLFEVRREISDFDARVQVWLRDWADSDKRGLFHSQRTALQTLLVDALQELTRRCEPGRRPADEAALLGHAVQLESLRLWLRRVYRYYRDKVDQRAEAGACLAGADEVMWSCYAPSLFEAETYGLPLTRRPPPLAYLHDHLSPAAILPNMVPGSVRTYDRTLAAFIETLPIPLLCLPESNRRAPWWLVFVGHEVGHHLQYALAPDAALIGGFREAIKDVVRDKSAVEPYRWGEWSMELFADMVSVHLMGPEAVSAVAHFELANAGALTEHRERYPAPLWRVALLCAFWRCFSGDDRVLLPKVWAEAVQALPEIALFDAVAEIACGALPGLGVSFADLCGRSASDFLPGGGVDQRAAFLLGDQTIGRYASLNDAALFAAAGYRALSSLAGENVAGRKRLATRLLGVLQKCGPDGTRAAGPAETLTIPDPLTYFADLEPQ